MMRKGPLEVRGDSDVRGAGDGHGLTVLCDFDGTVSLIDTAEYILERHASGDWRAFERSLAAGLITLEECMSAQFDMIALSRDEMLVELDRVVIPRPGFAELVEKCLSNNVTFRITSAGMDFYIRHFLEPYGWRGRVELVAPEVVDNGKGVRFQFPPQRYSQARNFKEDNVLREHAAGRRVAYIGDGTSDQWAAMAADMAFAVRGSVLDRLLEKAGKERKTFTDLHEVVEELFPGPRRQRG
jgi:2-hydroxy-3-keto-5-methylthiopentenyl-1-phosphate phosphatase